MGNTANSSSAAFAASAAPLRAVSLAATCLVLGLAPLLVGTVHAWSIGLVSSLGLVAAAALSSLAVASHQPLRGARYAWPLALFVALPVAQVIPLPLSLRGWIDPAGNGLLANAPPPLSSWFPLSLDPETTKIEILRAALALLVFIAVLNLSAGRRGRSELFARIIAASALVGVFIGVVHPFLNFDKVYATYATGGSPTLLGPFVNPNHSAEFFELGCFACLACAFVSNDKLIRWSWFCGSSLCGAAALLTLSRGSLIGLTGGGIALYLGLRDPRAATPASIPMPPRPWILPAVLAGGGVIMGLAAGLGALPILDELAKTKIGDSGEKTDVWFDALRVLRAHPFGVGRGAFDRVYPAYRTLAGPVQQTFVENEVLQALTDFGWLGCALIAAATIYFVVVVRRRLLHDRFEAALVAAVVAVAVHNVFDFGLETLGIRLPVVAATAAVVGRLLSGKRPSDAPRPRTWLPVALGVTSVALGITALASSKNFDERLKEANTQEERRLLALAAARTHPTDYFYPLTQATAEPLVEDQRSPRLTALGRATRLCPNCSNVHRLTGKTLWQLRKIPQALTEYRIAMDLDPEGRWMFLDELAGLGATPAELAALEPQTPAVAAAVAQRLVEQNVKGSAPRAALAHARVVGGSEVDVAILEIRLALNEGDLASVGRSLARLEKGGKSPVVFYWRAVYEERLGHKPAALILLNEATGLFPDDISLARQRVYLATEQQAWGDLERAIEGLKHSLQGAGLSVTEAYILSGQANVHRGNLPRAIRDYQTAASIEPTSLDAWHSLAAAAESGGFYTQALEAYRQALRIDPKHSASLLGLHRIEELRARSRLDTALRGSP